MARKALLFLTVALLGTAGCAKDTPTEPHAADTQTPTAAILFPANGAVIKADTVYTIVVDAADDRGVTSIDLYIDGSKAASGSSSPFRFSWKTTGIGGAHSMMAKASDAAGNVSSSEVVALNVVAGNDPPRVPSNPTPANVATGAPTDIALSWSCSDPNGDELLYTVSFGVIGDAYSTLTTNDANASVSFKGLSNNTTYAWKVDAKDGKGAVTEGPWWTFTTSAGAILPGMTAVPGGGFATTPLTVLTGFKIDKFEVTYELWTQVREWGLTHGYTDLPVGQNGFNPVGANNPVTMVNWYDVVKWCNARSEKDGLAPVYYTEQNPHSVYRTGERELTIYSVRWNANGYQLPTEAEWEYAARGGAITNGSLFSGSGSVNDVAWTSSNAGNATHPAGQKRANELGIYDMSGNVAEWCWDWYGAAFPSTGKLDPIGPSTVLSERVVRGGSFSESPIDVCRVNHRSSAAPVIRSRAAADIGFRCVQR